MGLSPKKEKPLVDDAIRIGHVSKADRAEELRPETMRKPEDQTANDGVKPNAALLSEQTITNKEQRKADLAIMKEMSRYLWPKVRLHVRRAGGARILRWT